VIVLWSAYVHDSEHFLEKTVPHARDSSMGRYLALGDR
jgi:hypothetical protein